MFVRIAALAVLLSAPLSAQAPAKAAPPAATETLPDGRALIEKHIKAIGGRQALLGHKSLQVKGTMSVAASGITAPIEIFAAASPNRMIMKTSVSGIGDIMEGFDGSHGWSVNPMTGPMLKVNKELQQAKLDADFYSDLRDPKTYLSVKTVEKTTYDGRPAYKVALSRIDGAEDFDFYDAATGLRSGSIITRESPMGAMTVSSVVSDYQKFGNVLVPTSQTQKVMGVEQVLKITSVEFDKVDASVFAPPDAIKALIK
jgi:hypothetical protein